MNVHGDLRHTENFESQANLTKEQSAWSKSWDLLRKLQSGKGRLRFGFAGLVSSNKRVAPLLGSEYLDVEDVLGVVMLPMQAVRSTRYHKENRPVRMQVAVLRFNRDESGRPTLGGGPQNTVFEADGAKHPTQDHPMVRVMDYDPRRGETEERYGLELMGQTVSASKDVEVAAPAAGIFVSDTQIMDGWLVYLLDGLPVYRFPVANVSQIIPVAEEGAVVKEGEVLARVTGEATFAYHRTTYTDGYPDMDDDRVLSPLRGDTSVQIDDLYANVYVTVKKEAILVARFHADDVASGKVKLMPEQKVRGTGKYERARDMAPPANRVQLRVGDKWDQLVPDSPTGEEYMIARLVSPVEYGLAEFYPTGSPVWDRVNFSHDLIPVSRADCKPPLRLVGKMLALAKRLVLLKPSDKGYPQLRPVEDNWPKPYAVFSKTQLKAAGMTPEFNWSTSLREAATTEVSPKGDFSLRFERNGEWKCTGFDDDESPETRVLFFEKCAITVPVVSLAEQPDPDADLSDRPWTERTSGKLAALETREENPEGTTEVTVTPTETLLKVFVPKSAVVRKSVFGGEAVTCGSAIADWVPRQFYSFAELEQLLGNNLPWFANELLKHVAVERDNGSHLLPESYVSCIVSADQGLVLRTGDGTRPEEGVILLSPLSREDDHEYTWNVNGIFYDATPPHLVQDQTRPKKKRRRRPRNKAKVEEEKK